MRLPWIRPHLRPGNGSWRVDETYVRMKGRWTYLYRPVDSRGQTIGFSLPAKRGAAAAKRLLRKALARPHALNPRASPCTKIRRIRKPFETSAETTSEVRASFIAELFRVAA